MNSEPYYLSLPPTVFNATGPNEPTILRLLTHLEDPNNAATALFWSTLTSHRLMTKTILENGFGLSILTLQKNHPKLLHRTPKKCPITTLDLIMNSPTSLLLHIGTAKWTLKAGTTTVLHWAAHKGLHHLLKRALEKGADMEARDRDGYTPLHWAVWENDAVATRALLEMGASVNAEDNDGWTALQHARQCYARSTKKGGGPPVVIWLLLENEGDRNFKDETRWRSPLLHLAVMYGHVTLIRDLLDKGGEGKAVDVGVVAADGKTALHVAAALGDEGVVGLLLKNGADWNVRDKDGRRPVDLALKGGDAAALLAMLQ